MKTLGTGLVILAVLATAAASEPRHGRHGPHIVGTSPRPGERGFPITAEKDSIRINAVGEVISQPVPVIQKERNFNQRARNELSKPARPADPAPGQPAN